MTPLARRVLAIASAYDGAQAALLNDGVAVAQGRVAEAMGLAAALPVMVAEMLDRAGGPPELVAVIVGPGSFTGLRAGLSVAAGIGLALGIDVVGVSLDEAFAPAAPAGRVLWTAVEARRGRVFIARGAGWEGFATDSLPAGTEPVALCGNAAKLVAATLAARGSDVMLTEARTPRLHDVAAAALLRAAGRLAPRPAEPLYVDAAEARLPAGGLRGAPV